jgi:hypothetical protein
MEMRTCVCCGPKPVDSFAFRSRKRGVRQSRCRECFKKYRKRFYTENVAYYKEKAQQRNRKIRAENFDLLMAYLSEHPCVDCKEPDPVVLTFDHVRGEKLHNVSTMLNSHNWVEIEKEIEKCEVRCANCHLRRTSESRGWRKSSCSSIG